MFSWGDSAGAKCGERALKIFVDTAGVGENKELGGARRPGADGMDLVREIRTIYDNYPELETQILAASIRNVLHVKQAAMIGADVVTVPPAVLRALVSHPLTDKGLEQFLSDWKKTGQRIA